MSRWFSIVAIGVAGSRADAQSLAYHVAEPITSADVEIYAAWLNLSEEQVAFLHSRFEDYALQWKAEVDRAVPALDALSEAGGMQFVAPVYHPFAVSTYSRMKAEEARLADALARTDEALLISLSRVVAEAQSPALARIRLECARRRCDADERYVPGCWIDVTKFIRDICRSRPAPFGNITEVDRVLREHESLITPTFLELDNELDRIAIELQECEYDRQLKTVNENDPANVTAVNREALARIERILSKSAAMQRKLGRANETAIESVCEVLKPDEAAIVRAEWRQRVFPSCFPDRGDCTDIAANLRQSTASALNDDALLEKIVAYDQQYEAASRAMMEARMRWCEQVAATHAGEGLSEYVRRMRELREERWNVSDSFLKSAAALMPAGGVHEQIQHRRDFIERVRKDAASDAWPTP